MKDQEEGKQHIDSKIGENLDFCFKDLFHLEEVNQRGATEWFLVW